MKRILLIHNGLLLSAGVEKLLAQEIDLHLTSVDLDDESLIMKEIDHYQPHVVIFEESVQFFDDKFLLNLLSVYQDLAVLLINIRNNRVKVYKKQEIQITRFDDLVTAIRGG